jgi:ArsR family transcriptional regulator, virulence genes transcriptional regulator
MRSEKSAAPGNAMDLGDLEKNAERAANLLKAMSNDKRLLILCALYKNERCVGELEEIIPLSQSALSQHLARLRRDELVVTRRESQTIYYSLEDTTVKAMLHTLYGIYAPCEDIAARMT